MDPGIYTHSESKSCEKMIEQVPTYQGLEYHQPIIKRRIPYHVPPWVGSPPLQKWKKDSHTGGQTQQQLKSHLLLVNFYFVSDKFQMKRTLFSLVFSPYVHLSKQFGVIFLTDY